jgi:hypothetical protein
LASREIIRWYRGFKYRRTFVYPIEELYCKEKEYELIKVLKQWLNLAPPEITEEQLCALIPKAQYKYSKYIEGTELLKTGRNLLELMNPRYVGKEDKWAADQCFMCGRPQKACGRLLKSLPKDVRRTNLSRKIKDMGALKFQVMDDEDQVLRITRDHTLLVGIAEASLKAVQCRAVGDILRRIWRKDGRTIEPEELPTTLLSIESQCWAKVAQYYRLRGKKSARWAEDAAKICVQVCEMQFGGWTDANGLHLFSDHPSLCIARLHHAHTILDGRIGHRNLKVANKILSDARNALFAWTGAKKARETRLKLSSMKVSPRR